MSKHNEEYIVNEYLKGKNTKTLATELGTYNTSIRRILIKHKVQLRTSSEVWSNRPNPYTDIQSDICQYWLGILASDGNVFQTRITLQASEKDRELVETFAQFHNAPVKTVQNKKYGITEVRCEFKDKAIAESLKSFGITPNKSRLLKMSIPITWAFFRGVLDGDGCVKQIKNRAQISIATASNEFLEQLSDFLKSENVHHTINKTNSVFILGIYSKKDVFKCYENMYKTASVFLQRKKDKFGPLVSEMYKMQNPQIQGTYAGES